MKNTLITLCLLISYLIQAQNSKFHYHKNRSENCIKGQAIKEITMPNSNMQLSPTANIFNNSNGKGFIFPLREDNVTSFIKKSELIMGGYDQQGNLYVSTSGNKNEDSDFVPGPLDNYGNPETGDCVFWDQIFTVTKEEMLLHIDNFNKGLYKDPLNYHLIPASIKYWPGNNNPFLKEEIDFNNFYQLANYFDLNADASYDPSQGDIPTATSFDCVFPTVFPSSISFWIMNDIGGGQSISDGDPIKMQINCYSYSYDGEDSWNDNTYFKFDFINNADFDLLNFYFGFTFDFDLGCPYDDNIGIDTIQNLMYMYNDTSADGNNQNNCEVNNNGYSPYMVGLKYLGNLRSPKVFTTDTNGNLILEDPETGSGDVDTLVQSSISSFIVKETCNASANCDYDNDYYYYNTLLGKKFDGGDFTNNENVIKHMYPDSPDNQSGWSMCNDNSIDGKDIEAMISIGPILLQPGAFNSFNLAFQLINNVDNCPNILPFIHESNRSNEVIVSNCFRTDYSYPLSPSLEFNKLSESQIQVTLPDDEQNQIMKSFSELFYIDPKGHDTDVTDTFGEFEGIVIYQLKDSASWKNSKIGDENNMRLIHQSDLENEVVEAYNYFPIIDAQPYNINNRKWGKELMVNGTNSGIANSFLFEDDLFESGEDLINGKTYWFAAYSYAYNNWKELDTFNGYGQRTQFWSANPKIYQFTFDGTTNTDEQNNGMPLVSCSNNTLKILNITKPLNAQVYEIDGKIITSINLDFNKNEFNLNNVRNKLLIVELMDLETKYRSVNKVLCLE